MSTHKYTILSWVGSKKMGDFIKGKLFTIITVIITVILAGVAVFTAIRLYQLRQESISPTSPESEPEACEETTQTISCTSLAFTLTEVSPTPNITDTITPTYSVTPTITNTPTPTDSEVTSTPTLTPTDTPLGGSDPTATPTNTPNSTSTPTPTTQSGSVSPDSSGQALPDAGISAPTILGLFLGFLLITASFLLAL